MFSLFAHTRDADLPLLLAGWFSHFCLSRLSLWGCALPNFAKCIPSKKFKCSWRNFSNASCCRGSNTFSICTIFISFMYTYFNILFSQSFIIECLVYLFIFASLRYNLHIIMSFQSMSFGKYIQVCQHHLGRDIEYSHYFWYLLWGPLLLTNCSHFELMQSMTCLQINEIKPYVVFCVWFFHIWVFFFFFTNSSVLLNESVVHFLLLLLIHCIDRHTASLFIQSPSDGFWRCFVGLAIKVKVAINIPVIAVWSSFHLYKKDCCVVQLGVYETWKEFSSIMY